MPWLDPPCSTKVARFVAAAVASEADLATRSRLGLVLAETAKRIDAKEAADLCFPIAQNSARTVRAEIEAEIKSSYTGEQTISNLVELSARLDPFRSEQVLKQAVQNLAEPFELGNVRSNQYLEICSIEICNLLKEDDARRIYGPIAKRLMDAIENNGQDKPDYLKVVRRLRYSAPLMDPNEASHLFERAARDFAGRMGRNSDLDVEDQGVLNVAALLELMEIDRAEALALEVLRLLTKKDNWEVSSVYLLPQLEPELAWALARLIAPEYARARILTDGGRRRRTD